MKDSRDYPSILQGLFPGHPARRLLCMGVCPDESGKNKKKVITIKRGAWPEDYSKHLDPKSYAGEGALGIIPTYSKDIGEKTRWRVTFLSLDYDSVSMPMVMDLVAMLEEYRVYVYLDQGTTGRGVHLYVFPSFPLSQAEAHKVLITIANLSKQLKLPYPEFMPSSASGKSIGIFLPYRGAAEDGFGANPLIDPIGGEYISLEAAESEVFRTDVEDLRALVEDFGNIESESRASHNPSYNPIDTSTYEGALKAWDAEMVRLKEVWVEGKRQHLTLGASAYGISIGISAEKLREDIEVMESTSCNPEVDDRLKAVNGTIERHVKGERIAWRKWYLLADVEPPRGNRIVPWDVLLKLQVLEDQVRSAPFKGMGGFTDRDVLDTLIEVGRKYGKPHAEGVEISISTRNLALEARTGNDTIINSFKRVKESGWVKRGNRSRGTHSGSLVLLIDDRDVTSHELVDEGTNAVHIPKFRWGKGKIGKTSRPILQTVQRLQPCTRADVARAMGRDSRGIRNPMNRLWEYQLVHYDEDTNTYTLPADFQDRLFEVLFADGTLETDFKHKKRFARERMAFRALLDIKRQGQEMDQEQGGGNTSCHSYYFS